MLISFLFRSFRIPHDAFDVRTTQAEISHSNHVNRIIILEFRYSNFRSSGDGGGGGGGGGITNTFCMCIKLVAAQLMLMI